MPSQPLTNFEIVKYCGNEPRFNTAYSRNNLPKIKDGVNVINLDEYYNKYLQNTSMQFNNLWIRLYWIY